MTFMAVAEEEPKLKKRREICEHVVERNELYPGLSFLPWYTECLL